jgi:hypothetical protein
MADKPNDKPQQSDKPQAPPVEIDPRLRDQAVKGLTKKDNK